MTREERTHSFPFALHIPQCRMLAVHSSLTHSFYQSLTFFFLFSPFLPSLLFFPPPEQFVVLIISFLFCRFLIVSPPFFSIPFFSPNSPTSPLLLLLHLIMSSLYPSLTFSLFTFSVLHFSTLLFSSLVIASYLSCSPLSLSSPFFSCPLLSSFPCCCRCQRTLSCLN